MWKGTDLRAGTHSGELYEIEQARSPSLRSEEFGEGEGGVCANNGGVDALLRVTCAMDNDVGGCAEAVPTWACV